MKKICIIYANFQGRLLAKYLNRSQYFNQEYSIKIFSVHTLMQNQTKIPENLLKQARLFIYQPVKTIHGLHSSESILSKLNPNCRCLSFPSLYFTGYLPQICKNPVNKVIKPKYPFGLMPHGDRNIIKLLESGKSVTEIITILSDPDFYSREFLLLNLDETLAELALRESQLSIKVSQFIRDNYQKHYLFYTSQHPSDVIGIYVVNHILSLLELPKINSKFAANNIKRGVLDDIQIPIYPSVIKHLNLNFVNKKTVYKHTSFCTNKMTFTRYISEYIDLHQSASKSANSYYFKGIKFANKGKFQRAATAFKDAIKVKPDNAFYYGELAEVLQKNKKLDQAETVYKKAIELSPYWVDFYISLAALLIKKNNLRAAILTYKQAAILNPKNDQLYSLLGSALVDYGKLDLAQVAYEKAIKLNPNNSSYYRCLGDVCREKNSLDLAVINYQKAIALAPNSPWLHINLCNTLIQLDKLEEASRICHQANNFKQTNPAYYSNLGDIQLQLGNVDDALHTYQQAIKLNPNQMQRIFTHLGNILQGKAGTSVDIRESLPQAELAAVK
ncbi:MAG: WcbI family polysaccharide biosynthesis putative acetyltransferase [Cyanobacteria bacterium P01_G01_bin.67]